MPKVYPPQGSPKTEGIHVNDREASDLISDGWTLTETKPAAKKKKKDPQLAEQEVKEQANG